MLNRFHGAQLLVNAQNPFASPGRRGATHRQREAADVAFLLFFFSGFAGLIYQVIWTRQLGLVFGNTALSSSTTVGAFLCGLGLGARLAAPILQRGWPPGAVFAALETFVAVYSLILTWALPQMLPLSTVLVRQWEGESSPMFAFARFAIIFVMLLPGTLAMGATLPVLVEYCQSTRASFARTVSRLYAINTLGACLGALAGDFWLIRRLGLWQTSALASAIDLLVGALGFWWLRRSIRPATATSSSAGEGLKASQGLVIFLTGFCGIALEILWIRSLVFFNGSDIYAFSTVVSTFLFGLVLGSFVATRFGARVGVAGLLLGLALTIPISLLCTAHLREIRLMFQIQHFGIVRFLGAAVLILPATVLLGALFPLQTAWLVRQGAARAVGQAYILNAGGSLMGSLLTGFVLLPALGLQNCFFLAAAVAVTAAVLVHPHSRLCQSALLVALTLPWLTPGDALSRKIYGRDLPNILYREEDPYGDIALIRQWSAATWVHRNNLVVDGFNMMGNDAVARRYAGSLAALPMLLHPKPDRCLVICFGLANTLTVAVEMDRSQQVDCIEITPAAVRAASHLDYVRRTLASPKLRVQFSDGRLYLATTERRYDVITAEPPPPIHAGVVNLYTQEYFEHCKRSLNPGGIVSHWLPVDQMPGFEARTIIRACQNVFPHTYLWMGCQSHLILVASEKPLKVSWSELQQRYAPNQRLLSAYGLDNPWQVVAGCLRLPKELADYVAQTPPLRDDRPYLQHYRGSWTPDYEFFFAAPGRLEVTGLDRQDPNWQRTLRAQNLMVQILCAGYPDPESARIANWPRQVELMQLNGENIVTRLITYTQPDSLQYLEAHFQESFQARLDLFTAYLALGEREKAKGLLSPQWPPRLLQAAEEQLGTLK